MTMIAYKLFRVLKSGEITSLFINKTFRLPLNKWMKAEAYKTDGFKFRPGWHCTVTPFAPHLSLKKRAWYKVEIEDYRSEKKPKNQGGTWLLANKLKIIERYE